MFNNAGITWGGDTELLTLDQWNAIIDVNIRGVVHGVAAAYPQMVKQGHGHIVNTASMAGLAAAGQITSYVMSKHAIVGLSLALRSEAAGRGVGVLAVCPTAVETPILDKGAVGGFVGRDFYKMGQAQLTTFSSADGLARDTLTCHRAQQGTAGVAAAGAHRVAVLAAGAWAAATDVDRIRQTPTRQSDRGRFTIRWSRIGNYGDTTWLRYASGHEMDTEFTLTQKRALAVATAIAILFGACFLRGYFILIVVAAVGASTFTPLFNRLNRRFGTGLSATLTLLTAIAAVVVPLGVFVYLAVSPRSPRWSSGWRTGSAGPTCRPWATRRCGLSTMSCTDPFTNVTVTADSLRSSMAHVAQEAGQGLLGLLQGADWAACSAA